MERDQRTLSRSLARSRMDVQPGRQAGCRGTCSWRRLTRRCRRPRRPRQPRPPPTPSPQRPVGAICGLRERGSCRRLLGWGRLRVSKSRGTLLAGGFVVLVVLGGVYVPPVALLVVRCAPLLAPNSLRFYVDKCPVTLKLTVRRRRFPIRWSVGCRFRFLVSATHGSCVWLPSPNGEVAGEGSGRRPEARAVSKSRVDGARSRPGRRQCSTRGMPFKNPRLPDAGLDLDVWPSSLPRCLAKPREKESGPDGGDGYKTD